MSRSAAKRISGSNKRVKPKKASHRINRRTSRLRKRGLRTSKRLFRGRRTGKRGFFARAAVPLAQPELTAALPQNEPEVSALTAKVPLVGILFSKDRALQLDAALRSLYLHALDISAAQIKVLYTTSNAFYEAQYDRLKASFPQVQFIREEQFRQQILAAIENSHYVMFIVDDCLFVRDFTLQSVMNTLAAHGDLLGFSLRLGPNIRYCYTMDAPQAIPAYQSIEYGYCKFDWTAAQHEFGYPLEVSSSVYRTDDLLPHLQQLDFSNPNTFEGIMAGNARGIAAERHYLACNEASLAFCNPLNLVQNVYANRAVNKQEYSSHELALLFENGNRIDVTRYTNLIPEACHQHVSIF
ncbi:hypothetical protein [Paenibacillus paridis]|uniref:hypothetical protein n=1 Tax=Paenibacillus paridis TaxID=2583376 RepID=UPI00111F25C9|nr:hypothetical protein [Paenibacillus paridis]